MKRTIYTLIFAMLMFTTGCGTGNTLPPESIPGDVPEEHLVQAPGQTEGELAYVLYQVGNEDYLAWEKLLAIRIYEMRDDLLELGYSISELGIKYQDNMPVLLANTVNTRLAEDMKLAALDTGLVEMGNERKLETMTRLYNTLLLYNVLWGKLQGIQRVNTLTLPDIDITKYQPKMAIGTEYDINGKSFATMMVDVIADKHELSTRGMIEVVKDANTEEWIKSGTRYTMETEVGIYAYLDESPKHQAYKNTLDALGAMEYVMKNYENKSVSMARNYYTYYELEYTV